MNKRSYQRFWAIKTLYAMEIHGELDIEISKSLLRINNINFNKMNYTFDILKSYINNSSDIEEILIDNSTNYPVNRLPLIDLSVIHVALTEIFYLNIPPQIAINEAVDFSKRYSDSGNYKFVNSILGNIIRNLNA